MVIDSQLREGKHGRRELCRRLLKEVLKQRSKKTQKHTVESHQGELIRNQRQNSIVSGSSKENTVLRNE